MIPGPLDERGRRPDRRRDARQPAGAARAAAGAAPAQLAGGFGLPGALPLSGRIEQSFRRRLEALPADTRRLLLVAAAEPIGDPALLWRAAERLGIAAEAAAPAETAGLLEIGARVRVPPSARALGGLPGGDAAASAARRTGRWPRRPTPSSIPTGAPGTAPQATPAPDEDVAAELERSAGRAQARGGLAAAAAFLERAAALTPDPAPRAQRALAAAQAKLRGRRARRGARRCWRRPRPGRSTSSQRARVDLLRGEIAFA